MRWVPAPADITWLTVTPPYMSDNTPLNRISPNIMTLGPQMDACWRVLRAVRWIRAPSCQKECGAATQRWGKRHALATNIAFPYRDKAGVIVKAILEITSKL
jgi:hypothetical protein